MIGQINWNEHLYNNHDYDKNENSCSYYDEGGDDDDIVTNKYQYMLKSKKNDIDYCEYVINLHSNVL